MVTNTQADTHTNTHYFIHVVHDLQPFGVKKFNMSHTIQKLSFGREYPGIVNPLNGHSEIDTVTQQGMYNDEHMTIM